MPAIKRRRFLLNQKRRASVAFNIGNGNVVIAFGSDGITSIKLNGSNVATGDLGFSSAHDMWYADPLPNTDEGSLVSSVVRQLNGTSATVTKTYSNCIATFRYDVVDDDITVSVDVKHTGAMTDDPIRTPMFDGLTFTLAGTPTGNIQSWHPSDHLSNGTSRFYPHFGCPRGAVNVQDANYGIGVYSISHFKTKHLFHGAWSGSDTLYTGAGFIFQGFYDDKINPGCTVRYQFVLRIGVVAEWTGLDHPWEWLCAGYPTAYDAVMPAGILYDVDARPILKEASADLIWIRGIIEHGVVGGSSRGSADQFVLPSTTKLRQYRGTWSDDSEAYKVGQVVSYDPGDGAVRYSCIANHISGAGNGPGAVDPDPRWVLDYGPYSHDYYHVVTVGGDFAGERHAILEYDQLNYQVTVEDGFSDSLTPGSTLYVLVRADTSNTNQYGFNDDDGASEGRRMDTADGVAAFITANSDPLVGYSSGIISWLLMKGYDPRHGQGQYPPDFDVVAPEVAANLETLINGFNTNGHMIGIGARPAELHQANNWDFDVFLRRSPEDKSQVDDLVHRFEKVIGLHTDELDFGTATAGFNMFYLDVVGDKASDFELVVTIRDTIGTRPAFAEYMFDLMLPYVGGFLSWDADNSTPSWWLDWDTLEYFKWLRPDAHFILDNGWLGSSPMTMTVPGTLGTNKITPVLPSFGFYGNYGSFTYSAGDGIDYITAWVNEYVDSGTNGWAS